MGTLRTFISGKYILPQLKVLIITGVYGAMKQHGLAIGK